MFDRRSVIIKSVGFPSLYIVHCTLYIINVSERVAMKKLVGLTGKTGAGKSTVSMFFKENGAYIIDGDIIAREVLQDDKSLLEKLENAFSGVLNSDGSLNRKNLARKAFASPSKTQLLNTILHPAINEKIENEAENAFKTHNVVVVDAAAIIESGFADKCDILFVCHAPVEVRKERIMKRDNISEEDALVRIKGQKDDEFYISQADIVINNFEPYDLNKQLEEIKKELFN